MITGALDCLRVPPKKRKGGKEKRVKRPARAAKEHIGGEIEHAVRARHLQERDVKKIQRGARYKRTRKERLALERKYLRERLKSIPKWTKTERFYVGNWGLDCCLQALPDVFTT